MGETAKQVKEHREKVEFEPVLTVDIKTGEILLDRRAEVWSYLAENNHKGEGKDG